MQFIAPLCFLFLALAAIVTGQGLKPTKDIVALAASTPQLSTLVTAVSAVTGLPAALKSAGPFTVFAPNNAAFAKLPAGTLQALLKDPNGKLASILKYHVVSGKITAKMLKTGKIKTLGGSYINVRVCNSGVILNGNIHVIAADIFATNGVVDKNLSLYVPTFVLNM
jgi:uncharacterized surface protein with fasciclin (FAS1) repeats